MTTQVDEIFLGDTPEYEFTLEDDDGDAIDLTNATEVRFAAKPELDSQIPDNLAQFNRTCSIDAPATAGICRVTLTIGDTDQAGRYIAEVQVKFSGGAVATVEQFLLIINKTIILS